MASDACQYPPGAEPFQFLLDFGKRRGTEHPFHILEDFDIDAAIPEENHWSESRILQAADEHIVAFPRHGGHPNPLQPRPRIKFFQIFPDQRIATQYLLPRSDADQHPACLRFVDSLGGNHFQHHRVTDHLGDLDGLALCFGHLRGRAVEVVERKEFTAFLAEDTAVPVEPGRCRLLLNSADKVGLKRVCCLVAMESHLPLEGKERLFRTIENRDGQPLFHGGKRRGMAVERHGQRFVR